MSLITSRENGFENKLKKKFFFNEHISYQSCRGRGCHFRMGKSHFSSQYSPYFFKEGKNSPRQDYEFFGCCSSMASFQKKACFLKKAQIILKGHFSLSLKIITLLSPASSSPETGETHSQESHRAQTKEPAGSQRELWHAWFLPGMLRTRSLSTGTWHSTGASTHKCMHTEHRSGSSQRTNSI